MTWRSPAIWIQSIYAFVRLKLDGRDELEAFQAQLLGEVQRASKRTLAGVTCYPTGAFVSLHPRDMPLWRGLRHIVAQELDVELRRRAAEVGTVRYEGCRVVAMADVSVARYRPRFAVDWLPMTAVMADTTATHTARMPDGVQDQARSDLRLESAAGPSGRGLLAVVVGRGRGVHRADTAEVVQSVTTEPAMDPAGQATVTGRPAEYRKSDRSAPIPSSMPEVQAWITVGGNGAEDPAARVPLPSAAGAVLFIGRGHGMADGVDLPDARVSRKHASIQIQGTQWVVQDLCSGNGTYLDGVRINRPTPLPPKSVIRVGWTKLYIAIGQDYRPEAS